MTEFESRLKILAAGDISTLVEKNDDKTGYAGSWKKRGGIGAFMMAARKWDRMEVAVTQCGLDIFEAAKRDRRPEGILDDIKDLRCYLLLIEDEIRTLLGNPAADLPS